MKTYTNQWLHVAAYSQAIIMPIHTYIDREAINTELRFIVSEKFEISNISRDLSFKFEFFILQYIIVKFFQTSCYCLFFYWIPLYARGHLYQIVLYITFMNWSLVKVVLKYTKYHVVWQNSKFECLLEHFLSFSYSRLEYITRLCFVVINPY